MQLFEMWKKAAPTPMGRMLFRFVIKRFVPYSGTVYPNILEWRVGYAKIEIKDRRIVRNHLNCIHAVALINVAELAAGLAVFSAIPDSIKGIVTRFEIDYVKKGRGTLVAISETTIPEVTTRTAFQVPVTVYNETSEVVCKGVAHWLLQPR